MTRPIWEAASCSIRAAAWAASAAESGTVRLWPQSRISVSLSRTLAAAVRRKRPSKSTAVHTAPGERSYPQIKADVRRLVDVSRCPSSSRPCPRRPVARIGAWLMMLLGMWRALKLGLVVTLLSGLLVFQLSHVLASTVEGRLRPGRARAIDHVIVLSAVISSVLVLAAHTSRAMH